MNNERDFKFQYVSKEDFNRTYKKITRDRQKQIDDWHWSNYVESIKAEESKSTFTIENNNEDKEIVYPRPSDMCSISKFSTLNSAKLYSLHDPSDINNIHGLRNRLFKTFNEYSTILENALQPPVLKNPKKIRIKTKELDQRANKNYINDLNKLLTELKQDFKNKDLHEKKDKRNIMFRRLFQMKLICGHKLAIDAIKVCSQTLEARIYNSIQDKMKELIQIISCLSSTTGKYLYGQLYNKKKKESYDLVAACKTLINMLDDCGYKDVSNDNQNNIHCEQIGQSNKLNELTSKALTRKKSQITNSNFNHLSMYNQIRPKLGSCYAQKWSKNNKITDKTQSPNCANNFEDKTLLTKNENKFVSSDDSIDNCHNFDDVKTAVQQFCLETNEQFEGEIGLHRHTHPCTSPKSILSGESNTPKHNIGLYVMKENVWRNFKTKNVNISEDGQLKLIINQKNVDEIISYRRQFSKIQLSDDQVETIFSVTESIADVLLNKVLLKLEISIDDIITDLVKMELSEHYEVNESTNFC
ncbi:uncharacterized protein LOC126844112 isoform X2 [Adelges cooleyi]|uniref:uncharacterized protein LOC126838973 isoform X2 n=1 Tax=Adelges cooleyi TaxID=133065 RepID=UPI00217FC16E|nr:uncharacterized protein LOC126838973 isoform X2 [Adelges cooleyi]XP_050437938.1 uncharacterized protein LOC126844112 isoform X2 [Adelges cooleyi]